MASDAGGCTCMSDHGRIIPLSHEPYEDERFEEAGWPDSLIRLSVEEKRRQAAALQKKAREKRRPEGRRYECAPGMRSFRARGTILNWTGRRARGSPSTWA